MKCIECKFWRREEAAIDPEGGRCHRHAPRPAVAGDGEVWTDVITSWPGTFANDFCGEFAAVADRKGFV